MTAEAKMRRWVTSATILLMASGFSFLEDLHKLEKSPWIVIPLGVLTGLGLFEALTALLEFLFEHLRFMRRWILGNSYIEGLWAGCYIGSRGEPRLVIESIRQTWSSTSLTAQAFHDDGTPHGQWHSVIADLDGEKSIFRATLAGNLGGLHYDSMAEYHLEGEPPKTMSGFVTDIVSNPNAGRVWMKKTWIKAELSENERLAAARATCMKRRTPHGPDAAPDVAVREAQEDDLAAVLIIYRESRIDDQDAFDLDAAREHFERFRKYPSNRLFVAESGGVVAGAYSLLIMDNLAKGGKPSGVVEDVGVLPEWQGRGLGTAMMQHAMSECRRAGCYKLALSSNANRASAHRFYERLGFELHGYSFRVTL